MSDGSTSPREVKPELSVVVLCYRAQELAPDFAEQLARELGEAGIAYELILVANYDERIPDRTPEIVRELARSRSRIVAITRVKEGMMGWDMPSGLVAARGAVERYGQGVPSLLPGSPVTAWRGARKASESIPHSRREKMHGGIILPRRP